MAKMDKPGLTRVGVLAYESCSAWISAGLLELFGVANVVPGPAAAPTARRFEYHLLGAQRRVAAANGVILPTRTPARRYDVVIVPPLWAPRHELEPRMQRLHAERALLRRLKGRTRVLASACTGAVLLADAGLLDGHRATTCWWLGDWFAERFPAVQLVLDRVVMADGARWSAGAGSAYVHLGLELVQHFAGAQVAAGTARALLVERRRGSQSPFLGPPAPLEPLADEVQRAVAHLDAHPAQAISVGRLARVIGVHPRTLARKFQQAMGMPPLAYLQARRVALAKQLLEASAMPLEQIVPRCGYEDVSSFRKLFTRHVGMTPREYRSRFGLA